ncbi:MAG: hypothetical protein J0626_03115 [Rhodospirillaceae bacterium]|nr:hypothetical protein [Rhodospirillaceae bacterium]
MDHRTSVQSGRRHDRQGRYLAQAPAEGRGQDRPRQGHKMLPEYYQLRGWTTDGVPTAETLSRLSL